MLRALQPLVSPETWSATGFLVATLFVGVWWFLIIGGLAVVGFATLVVFVGVPLLIAAAAVTRAAATIERGRLGAIGVELPVDDHRPPADVTGWSRLRWELANPATVRQLVYVFLLFVLGPIWFSLTMSAWIVPLSLIATPFAIAAGFEPAASSEANEWEIVIDTMQEAVLIAGLGALLLPLAPRFIRAMARAHGRLAEALLGQPSSNGVGRSTDDRDRPAELQEAVR